MQSFFSKNKAKKPLSIFSDGFSKSPKLSKKSSIPAPTTSTPSITQISDSPLIFGSKIPPPPPNTSDFPSTDVLQQSLNYAPTQTKPQIPPKLPDLFNDPDKRSSNRQSLKSSGIWIDKKISGFLPFPRRGLSVASHVSDIYLFAGRADGILKNDLIKLDTNEFDSAIVKANGYTPEPREGHASAFIGRTMFVFGGELEDGRCDDNLYAFNIGNEMWYKVPVSGKPLIGRKGHSAVSISSSLYIFGGTVDGYYLQDLTAFDVRVAATDGPSWNFIETFGDVPSPRAGHSCNALHGKIYIYGGMNGEVCFNDLWVYTISEKRWSQVVLRGATPPPRYGHASSIVDDCIFIMGGRTMEGQAITDFFAYKIHTQRWYTFPVQSSKWPHRVDPVLSVFKNKLILFSGNATRSTDSNVLNLLDTNKIKIMPDSSSSKLASKSDSLSYKRPVVSGSGLYNNIPERRNTDGDVTKINPPSDNPNANYFGPMPSGASQSHNTWKSASFSAGHPQGPAATTSSNFFENQPYIHKGESNSTASFAAEYPQSFPHEPLTSNSTNITYPKINAEPISAPPQNFEYSNRPALPLPPPPVLSPISPNPEIDSSHILISATPSQVISKNEISPLKTQNKILKMPSPSHFNSFGSSNNLDKPSPDFSVGYPQSSPQSYKTPVIDFVSSSENKKEEYNISTHLPSIPEKTESSQTNFLPTQNQNFDEANGLNILPKPEFKKDFATSRSLSPSTFETQYEDAVDSSMVSDSKKIDYQQEFNNSKALILQDVKESEILINSNPEKNVPPADVSLPKEISGYKDINFFEGAKASGDTHVSRETNSLGELEFSKKPSTSIDIKSSEDSSSSRDVNIPKELKNNPDVNIPRELNSSRDLNVSKDPNTSRDLYVSKELTSSRDMDFSKELNGSLDFRKPEGRDSPSNPPIKDKRLTIQLRNRMSQFNLEEEGRTGKAIPPADNRSSLIVDTGSKANDEVPSISESATSLNAGMVSSNSEPNSTDISEISRVVSTTNQHLNLEDQMSPIIGFSTVYNQSSGSKDDVWAKLETKYGLTDESVNQDEYSKLEKKQTGESVNTEKLASLVVALRKELDGTKLLLAQSLRSAVDRINDAEKGRRAALQEAIYLKTKASALASGNAELLMRVNAQRTSDLERQLANTINENDALRNQMSESTLILKRTQERLSEYQLDSEASRQQLRHMERMYQIQSASMTSLNTSDESKLDKNDEPQLNKNLDEVISLRAEITKLQTNEQGLLLDIENALRASSAASDRSDKLQQMLDRSVKENEQLEAEMMKLVSELESERSVNSRLKLRVDQTENLLVDLRQQVSALQNLKSNPAVSNGISSLKLGSLSTGSLHSNNALIAEMQSAFLSTQKQWAQARDDLMTQRQMLRNSDERRQDAESKLVSKERQLENALARLDAFTKLVENLDSKRRNRARSLGSIRSSPFSNGSGNVKARGNTMSGAYKGLYNYSDFAASSTVKGLYNNVTELSGGSKELLNEGDSEANGFYHESASSRDDQTIQKTSLELSNSKIVNGTITSSEYYIDSDNSSLISPSKGFHESAAPDGSITDQTNGDSATRSGPTADESLLSDDNTVSIMLSTLHQLQKPYPEST
ncbi:Tip elongation aberrant protein 1 [Smittium mucronatum]|uniref:Tip elongation aberrant protein 1 n=1 Tax=Smittium mucronatum TaxID=133383 RepID=A0A1R0GNM8_9FUNG|nr:Tip elongation aberrant protein 1 [Smittium mucronatum]OLY81331.1 Tip elongation aberrant protein 1 [Smittium mucronatum]